MSKGFASSYRIVLLAAGLFVCFVGLSVRLVFLHVIDREALVKTIEKTRTFMAFDPARRGDILDANGARLATSTSRIVLGVDPLALRPQDEKNWAQLAEMIELPEAEMRRIFARKYYDVVSAKKESTRADPETKAERPALTFNFELPSAAASRRGADEIEESADTLQVDSTPDDKGRRAIRWAKLRDEISDSLYESVQKLGIKGVYGRRFYRRVYPSNELAAHLIGYVNREEKPVTGVEAFADFYLRGQDGWRVSEKDARGRELAQFRTREVPRVDGFSVKLTIESRVQDIIEQELVQIGQKYEPLKATIVVSDPRDGRILGMANYPTFNPNEYNKVPPDEVARMKNVAVADIYEPGSVFKIVPVSAALEEGLVSPQSVFDCTLTQITHRGRTVALPAEDHPMGELSVSEIISHSSNKGAAQLGIKVGEEKLYRYARAFGFGTKIGFPVGGEVAGLFHPWQEWYPIDITRITMGHSISSTVLQMHSAMSVIASRGAFLRPQLIKEIRDNAGNVVCKFGREEMHRVISRETAQKVALMLTGVTRKKEGTAPEAAIEGYDVAGKTGTTQKLVEETMANGTTKLVYSKKHHVASFVGFFPAGDPQVAISVIVDDADHRAPNGVAYGAKIAAPSFKRIGERLIPILDIKAASRSDRSTVIAVNEGAPR